MGLAYENQGQVRRRPGNAVVRRDIETQNPRSVHTHLRMRSDQGYIEGEKPNRSLEWFGVLVCPFYGREYRAVRIWRSYYAIWTLQRVGVGVLDQHKN
jgi:hypothetical protein